MFYLRPHTFIFDIINTQICITKMKYVIQEENTTTSPAYIFTKDLPTFKMEIVLLKTVALNLPRSADHRVSHPR